MEYSPRNSDPNRKYHKVLLLVDYKDLRVILEALDKTEKVLVFQIGKNEISKTKLQKFVSPNYL